MLHLDSAETRKSAVAIRSLKNSFTVLDDILVAV
jgi:hypothetical protein